MTGLFYVVGIVLVMPAVGTVMNVVLAGLFTSLKVTLTSRGHRRDHHHRRRRARDDHQRAGRRAAEQHRRGARDRGAARGGHRAAVPQPPVAVRAATTGGVQGKGSYIVPFLVVVALVVTQLVGFETAGAFAEETKQSRIKPSQAIIAGLGGTALVLFIFDLALILSLPNVSAAMANPDLIPSVLTADLGLRLRQAVPRRRADLGVQHGHRHAGDDRADDLRHGPQRPAARQQVPHRAVAAHRGADRLASWPRSCCR